MKECVISCLQVRGWARCCSLLEPCVCTHSLGVAVLDGYSPVAYKPNLTVLQVSHLQNRNDYSLYLISIL